MYKRVLVKVSGEVFGGGRHGLDYDAVTKVAYQISQAKELGVEIGVVVGGGNIIRGIDAQTHGVERATADYMGMLATVINALALQSMLEQKFGYDVRTQTAVPVHAVAEDFIQRVAIGHLEKKRIVIFAGGTGNPFFSTDTAAVLRAIEINADIMIKATKVDGVYDKDPKKFSDAVKYDELSYMSVLKQQLKVLDATAISLCMDNNLPVQVLDIFEEGNIRHAIEGKPVGTMIK
jgi:uridylate kinase